METITKTVKKTNKEEILETFKGHAYEFFIGLLFILCLLAISLILGGIFLYPFCVSFFKAIET